MLGINREVLEFAVIGLTTIRVGYSLWTAAGFGACVSCCWCFVRCCSFPTCPSTAVVSVLSGWELVGLLSVSIAATAQEIISGHHRASKPLHIIQLVRFGSVTGSVQRRHNLLLCSDAVYGYDTKPADSEGLALGTVTLPWTFTALLITDLIQKGSSGKAMALN